MLICRGTNETNGQLFTSLFRDKLSLLGARTVDVGATKSAVRKVDPHFYNGYQMLPSIITMLHAKIKKEIPSK